jgi:hypothetical protein
MNCSSGYYLVCMLDMLDSSMFSLTKQSKHKTHVISMTDYES